VKLSLRGVIVPLLTLYDDAGDINAAGMRRLVEYLITAGVHGLFPGGTTGEGPLLSIPERKRLAEITVEAAAGRVPVIIHTGAITTADALELTRHAQNIGAIAAAIIPPFYYHYDDEALLWHYQRIADAVPDFPIYLYNNPAVAHNPLAVALISQLVERCPNIVGMKDSSGSLDYLSAVLALRDGDFNTASGNDGQILAAQAIGCDACVSGNANVVPELVVSLYQATTAGDLHLAGKLQQRLNTVRQILDDGADLSLFKGILARRGLPASTVRAPMQQTPEALVAQRWQALIDLGLEISPIDS